MTSPRDMFTSLLAAPLWATILYIGVIAVTAVLLIESVLALILGYWLEDTTDGYEDTIFGMPSTADEAQQRMDRQFQAITEGLDIDWGTQ